MKPYCIPVIFIALFIVFTVPLLTPENDNMLIENYHIPRQCYNKYLEPARFAVTSMISTASYVELAVVLGKSILLYSQLPCSVDKLLLVIEGTSLSPAERLSLENVGWRLEYISKLTAPGINPTTVKHERYIPLVSKLHIFGMTQYDGILFLDADTLVLGDIYELFTNDLRLMWTQGKALGWVRDQPATPTFNAGVMLVAPSQSLYEQLMYSIETDDFDFSMAEQGFLNSFFGEKKSYEISQKFNCLTPIPRYNSSLYEEIKDDVRIFHFTYFKPLDAFFYVRCIYYRTQRFCGAWIGINHLRIPPFQPFVASYPQTPSEA